MLNNNKIFILLFSLILLTSWYNSGCKQKRRLTLQNDSANSLNSGRQYGEPSGGGTYQQVSEGDSQGGQTDEAQDALPMQIFPLGYGAGLIGVDPEFERENEEAANNSLELTSDDNLEINPVMAASIMGAVLIGVGSVAAFKSNFVTGKRIEAGLGDFDLKTRVAHFQRKADVNMKKIAKNPKYAFTEIDFSEKAVGQTLGNGNFTFRNTGSDGRIVLGVLPDDQMLKSVKGQLNDGRQISVLSAVEDFELEVPFTYKQRHPVTGVVEEKVFRSFNSAALGDAWKHISTPDYRPVKGDLIDKGADFIAKEVANGRNVYVHCKSGKGRSATMVAAYLIKYRGFSADEAVTLIKSQRSQVSIAKKGLFGNHNKAIQAYAQTQPWKHRIELP